MPPVKYGIYQKYFKRPMDLILSIIAMIVLSPVLIIIAILVRIKLGSPVIFKQQRPGLNEKIFTMYKFRTMNDKRDEKGKLLSDEARLTKFGKLLRAISLDELPELWNVFCGDMAFVGPRPLLVKYLPYYTDNERKRHSIRPGLTGWAQVNGRNAISWKERFTFDIDYAEYITFRKDVHIILLTIGKVLHRSDILVGNAQVIQDLNIERKEIRVLNDITKIGQQ
jgi:undecaprenyl phosphate N,N'-diacetylbacillosamine 1-phosphate transferase